MPATMQTTRRRAYREKQPINWARIKLNVCDSDHYIAAPRASQHNYTRLCICSICKKAPAWVMVLGVPSGALVIHAALGGSRRVRAQSRRRLLSRARAQHAWLHRKKYKKPASPTHANIYIHKQFETHMSANTQGNKASSQSATACDGHLFMCFACACFALSPRKLHAHINIC